MTKFDCFLIFFLLLNTLVIKDKIINWFYLYNIIGSIFITMILQKLTINDIILLVFEINDMVFITSIIDCYWRGINVYNRTVP